jgi:thiamine-phosphate pyrophosphorylase
MPRTHDASQLCLVVDARGATAEDLRVALAAAAVSSVVFVAGDGHTLGADTLGPVVATAQAQLVAALLASDARLARTLKADGVHLPWSEEPLAVYAKAREILGTRAIVGADAGRSRHDAMQLGEAGADYIAFGIPAHVEDRAAAAARRLDLVAWWSEIFEVPVVAFDVEDAAEAAALAAVGADFVAARLPRGRAGGELHAWVRNLAASLGSGARTS